MTQGGRCEERIGKDGDHGEEEKMPQGVEGPATQTLRPGLYGKAALGEPCDFLMKIRNLHVHENLPKFL